MSQLQEAPLVEAVLVADDAQAQRATVERHLPAPWAIAVVVVIFCAQIPLLVAHFTNLWNNYDQYGYFPLIPVGAYVLVRQRLPGLGQLSPGSALLFGGLMLFAVLTEAVGVALFSPWVGAVAFLFCVFACIYGFGGRALTLRLFPVWLFLWLMVPLPFNWDKQLITSLQALTAAWSSRLLDSQVLGILHDMNGNAVDIPGHTLMVEEACSGVHSLFACLCATLFFVLWTRPGIVRGALLLISSVGWVLVANALRVVLITWLTSLDYNVLEGLPHTLLGVGIFVFVLAMVLSSDRLFMFFLPPKDEYWKRSRETAKLKSAPPRWPQWQHTWVARVGSLPVAACYALLAIGQLYLLLPAKTEAALPKAADTFQRLTENALPARWNDWQLIGFKEESRLRTEAEFSRYWSYRAGGCKNYVSVDYPFTDWHDLLICYRGLGWQVHGQTLHDTAEHPQAPYFEVEMSQPQLSYGYLLYFLFDEQGQPLEPKTYSFADSLRRRVASIRENWQAGGRKLASGGRPDCFQFQVFVQSYVPLTDAERQQAREFYRKACVEMRSKWLSGEPTAAGAPGKNALLRAPAATAP